jgi:hypothetical protein
VIEADARLDFAPGNLAALGEAVRSAVAQWRTDTHRIAAPTRALRYDPSVAAHVDALLALVRQWQSRHGERVADEPGPHPAHA